MDETYTAKAIVLNRQPYRENDSRVTVYSLEYGKLILVARGTGSIKSKMAGHIEPFCLSDFMIVRGRRYNYIGGVASRNCYSSIKSDLIKLQIAGQITRVFSRMIKENEPQSDLFFLLSNFLEFLNNNFIKEELCDFFIYSFMLKMLVNLGYEPELQSCVICGKKLEPEGNGFDISHGGLVCITCQQKTGLKISGDAIKLLRYIIKENFSKLLKLKFDKKVSVEIVKNIILFFDYNHSK